MPIPLIRAFAIVKKAAAIVNSSFGLKPEISKLIVQAADEVFFFFFFQIYMLFNKTGYRRET